MGKSTSIRRKHCKKMRAIKRERYAKKELEKLKEIVSNGQVDEEMVEVVPAEQVVAEHSKDTEVMDASTIKRIPSLKTLSKGKGQFPAWMNQRKIKRIVGWRKKGKGGKDKKKGKKKR